MGGVSSSHYTLGTVLHTLGHDVAFITVADSAAGEDSAGRGLSIRRFAVHPRLSKFLRFCARLFFRLLERGISYQVADICLNQFNMGKVRRVLAALQPDIVIVPDQGAPAYRLVVPHGCRVIEIEHHNPARFVDDLHMGAKICLTDVRWAVRLQQKALQHVDAVVCPSQYMQRVFKETYSFCGGVDVIPNMLDMKGLEDLVPVSVASRLELPEDTPVVYIPSGGLPLKGERYVLAIIQQILHAHPGVAFFISGNLSPMLRHELAAAQVACRCFAPGALPYWDNLALAASCSVCLSPCLVENYSMALAEALALGLPAIAFDSGGTSDIVNQECGSLVKYLDVAALIEEACMCLRDSVILQEKSVQARKRARDLQTIAEQRWIQCLERLSGRQQ